MKTDVHKKCFQEIKMLRKALTEANYALKTSYGYVKGEERKGLTKLAVLKVEKTLKNLYELGFR